MDGRNIWLLRCGPFMAMTAAGSKFGDRCSRPWWGRWFVEVPCVAVQHYDRVALPIDQDLVGALLPHGTDEPFRIAVGPTRRLHLIGRLANKRSG